MKDKKKKKKVEEEVKDPIQVLEEECRQYKEGWQRALADYENLKQDLGKERALARQRAREDLAQELLPVIDNFDQAVHHIPSLENCGDEMRKKLEPWIAGITYIEKQFTAALASLDVEMIEAEGLFDPHVHDAAGERREEGKPEGAVLEVLQKGWRLGDRVIRPAKVIINSSETEQN